MARTPRRRWPETTGDETQKPAMTNRRAGRWAWALSGEEGLTALVANQALATGLPLEPLTAQRYDRMLSKQKKLEERFPQFAPPSYR